MSGILFDGCWWLVGGGLKKWILNSNNLFFTLLREAFTPFVEVFTARED